MKTIKTATALMYNESMNAPQITTQLRGIHADEYIKLTTRYSIPVMKNSELAEKLKAIPESQQIPETLYSEVAKAFIAINKKSMNKVNI